jgi:hypothetical protein
MGADVQYGVLDEVASRQLDDSHTSAARKEVLGGRPRRSMTSTLLL